MGKSRFLPVLRDLRRPLAFFLAVATALVAYMPATHVFADRGRHTETEVRATRGMAGMESPSCCATDTRNAGESHALSCLRSVVETAVLSREDAPDPSGDRADRIPMARPAWSAPAPVETPRELGRPPGPEDVLRAYARFERSATVELRL